MKSPAIACAAVIFAFSKPTTAAAIAPTKRDIQTVTIDQYSGATCQQNSNQKPFSTFFSQIGQSTSGGLGDWPRSVHVTLPPTSVGCYEPTMTDSTGSQKTFENEQYYETSGEEIYCDDSGCSVCTTVANTGPNGPSWVQWSVSQN